MPEIIWREPVRARREVGEVFAMTIATHCLETAGVAAIPASTFCANCPSARVRHF